jgi:ABC-type phosphate/phosphonate transport system substrate-binding protein
MQLPLRYRALPVILLLLVNPLRADDPKPKSAPPLRIAIAQSLFRDQKQTFAKPVVDAFAAMVRSQTGLDSEIFRGGEAKVLADKISKNEADFGIFQGAEYAWVQKKHSDLKPLMIIVNGDPVRQGFLVARADSAVRGFADLKGKRVCMPLHSRLHCELFLERSCEGKDPAQFFAEFKQPDTCEEALDDLVDGKYDAAVVDKVAFKTYERRKPGRIEKLKVVKQSSDFPPSVVAYKPGRLDDARLKQFREGLIAADKSVLGRHLLMLWRMTAFQPVPGDLHQSLDAILKEYPPPRDDATAGKK